MRPIILTVTCCFKKYHPCTTGRHPPGTPASNKWPNRALGSPQPNSKASQRAPRAALPHGKGRSWSLIVGPRLPCPRLPRQRLRALARLGQGQPPLPRLCGRSKPTSVAGCQCPTVCRVLRGHRSWSRADGIRSYRDDFGAGYTLDSCPDLPSAAHTGAASGNYRRMGVRELSGDV